MKETTVHAPIGPLPFQAAISVTLSTLDHVLSKDKTEQLLSQQDSFDLYNASVVLRLLIERELDEKPKDTEG